MNFTSQSVTISKAEARALLAHAEKEGRVNMNGVFFDGRDLIATGRRENEGPAPSRVPIDQVVHSAR